MGPPSINTLLGYVAMEVDMIVALKKGYYRFLAHVAISYPLGYFCFRVNDSEVNRSWDTSQVQYPMDQAIQQTVYLNAGDTVDFSWLAYGGSICQFEGGTSSRLEVEFLGE